ncbi:hypothetical protein CYMTET_39155 [Cymbomonas tetramitiformis]|uniref:Uncharacterized protein n=1 Tax=Cymbomonas tetramitiformis TaxID=36881 RepID=A0AAE0CCP9_9CHLO|nr:hypothetical protein CYMTET_39155 [Cymbomonas tetramitiformis]
MAQQPEYQAETSAAGAATGDQEMQEASQERDMCRANTDQANDRLAILTDFKRQRQMPHKRRMRLGIVTGKARDDDEMLTFLFLNPQLRMERADVVWQVLTKIPNIWELLDQPVQNPEFFEGVPIGPTKMIPLYDVNIRRVVYLTQALHHQLEMAAKMTRGLVDEPRGGPLIFTYTVGAEEAHVPVCDRSLPSDTWHAGIWQWTTRPLKHLYRLDLNTLQECFRLQMTDNSQTYLIPPLVYARDPRVGHFMDLHWTNLYGPNEGVQPCQVEVGMIHDIVRRKPWDLLREVFKPPFEKFQRCGHRKMVKYEELCLPNYWLVDQSHPDLGVAIAEPMTMIDTLNDEPDIRWTVEANDFLHYIPLKALEQAEQARLLAYFSDYEAGRVLYTEEAASEYAALEHGRERRAKCKTHEEADRVLQTGVPTAGGQPQGRRDAAPSPAGEQSKTKIDTAR